MGRPTGPILGPRVLTRRRLLGTWLAGVVLLGTGCTNRGAPHSQGSPTGPDPDTLARAAARGRTADLQRAYQAAAAAEPALAARLAVFAADLAEHQLALGGAPAPSPAGTPGSAPAGSAPASAPGTPGRAEASPTPTAAPGPSAAPGPTAAPGPSALADLAAAVGTDLVELLGPVSAGLARLLASIAGCDATHAALLPALATARHGSTGPSPVAPATPAATAPPTVIPSQPALSDPVQRGRAVTALQPALAAEHAAVWAYGVVGAHSDPTTLAVVRRDLAEHRAWRDRLAELINRLGGQPVASLPAYQLPAPVDSPAAAAALALLVEQRSAVVWADVVAAVPATLRGLGAEGLAGAAVRAAQWRGRPVPFPGLAAMPARTGTPRATPGGTPTAQPARSS